MWGLTGALRPICWEMSQFGWEIITAETGRLLDAQTRVQIPTTHTPDAMDKCIYITLFTHAKISHTIFPTHELSLAILLLMPFSIGEGLN